MAEFYSIATEQSRSQGQTVMSASFYKHYKRLGSDKIFTDFSDFIFCLFKPSNRLPNQYFKLSNNYKMSHSLY